MSKYKNIISEIESFKNLVSQYFTGRSSRYGSLTSSELTKIRGEITKKSARIKKYLAEVDVKTLLIGRAPPVVGGFPFTCDLIEGMFQNEGGPYAPEPEMILDVLNQAIGIYEDAIESGQILKSENQSPPKKDLFIDLERIKQLESIKDSKFDLLRLLQILKELNSSFENENYLALIMLVRALIDHVPPLFNKATFSEVANNYLGKSFRDSMIHLENSSRKIADQCLHIQIREKEILPNRTQINFSNDIDVLLGEIVRILK